MNAAGVVLSIVAVAEAVAIVLLAVALRRSRRRSFELAEQLRRSGAPKRLPAPLDVAARAVQAAVDTAHRARSEGVGGLLRGSLEDFAAWAADNRREIARVAGPDGSVTVLFSDIENSTALNDRLGDERWLRVLRAHDELFRSAVARCRGTVVKSQGDGFMVVFAAVEDALDAAIAVQRNLAARPGRVLRRHPIAVRIGIHVGTAIAREGDYFGRNVAIAARVAAAAQGGEIVVSNEAKQAASATDRYAFRTPRTIELKGLPDPHEIWTVDWRPS